MKWLIVNLSLKVHNNDFWNRVIKRTGAPMVSIGATLYEYALQSNLYLTS